MIIKENEVLEKKEFIYNAEDEMLDWINVNKRKIDILCIVPWPAWNHNLYVFYKREKTVRVE